MLSVIEMDVCRLQERWLRMQIDNEAQKMELAKRKVQALEKIADSLARISDDSVAKETVKEVNEIVKGGDM